MSVKHDLQLGKALVPSKREALFVVSILLAALALYGAMNVARSQFAQGEYMIARISVDGTVVEEIDLQAVTETYTQEIRTEHGYNLLEISPGAIAVIQADCPDQVCVHQGRLETTGAPIACVPHGLSIVLISNKEGGLDGTTQ